MEGFHGDYLTAVSAGADLYYLITIINIGFLDLTCFIVDNQNKCSFAGDGLGIQQTYM